MKNCICVIWRKEGERGGTLHCNLTVRLLTKNTQKRSQMLRAHPGEVCFPGGMVSEVDEDETIVATSLREMSEEIGVRESDVNILGVLRCNWSEVKAITGVSVTPVIGFVGELNNTTLNPNADEVEEVFTVPLSEILKKSNWDVSEIDGTPVFTGGPYKVWGLTGFILNKFMVDVMARYKINTLKPNLVEGK